LLGCAIVLDALHKSSCNLEFLVDNLLVCICEVDDGVHLLLNLLGQGVELLKVHIKLRIVKMTVSHWLSNGTELVQTGSVLLLRGMLTFSI